MSYILLIVGFVLLVKGADYFVEGSSSIAKSLKIPSIIIGLTVVAFGTSAPEAAVSLTAAINGENEIALANIVGSNIFNILMVVGIASMIKPLSVKRSLIVKEFPFSILAGIVLFILCYDKAFQGYSENILTRADGIMLLVLFGIFMYSLITFAISSRWENAEDNEEEYKVLSPLQNVLYTLGGLVAIIFGGDFVVKGATNIALSFGVSETLIGLTIVAVGTSLPELITSIVAARKGESDIALGNVIGSNIFNIFFILGISATISPIKVDPVFFVDTILLIIASVITLFYSTTARKINRLEGGTMAIMYIAYTFYIIFR